MISEELLPVVEDKTKSVPKKKKKDQVEVQRQNAVQDTNAEKDPEAEHAEKHKRKKAKKQKRDRSRDNSNPRQTLSKGNIFSLFLSQYSAVDLENNISTHLRPRIRISI